MLLQKPVLRKKDTHLAVRFECFQQYTEMTQQSRVWAPMKTAFFQTSNFQDPALTQTMRKFCIIISTSVINSSAFLSFIRHHHPETRRELFISKNSTLSTVTGKFQQLEKQEKVAFNNSNPYLKPYHHTWNVVLLYAEHHWPYGKIQVQPL